MEPSLKPLHASAGTRAGDDAVRLRRTPTLPGRVERPLACVMGDMDLIRPLAMAGIACAAVAGTDDPTRFSRFNRAVIDRRDAWDDQEAQLKLLMRFGTAQSVPPVLFYAGDPELLLVSRHRRTLALAFRFVVGEAEQIDSLIDKWSFQGLAARLGLPVPACRSMHPAKDALVGLEMTYPLLVKPLTRHNELWEPVAGSAKAVKVDDPVQMELLWASLAACELGVVVQELVPGPESAIESYHVYIDASGEIAGEFTGRKIRTLPREFGHSTALETTDAPDVVLLGRDVMRRLGLRGLAKADFKRDPSGALHLLEVNPRFTLWHHLGARAGVNLPALVYADLTGLPRPQAGRARPGVRWSLPWQDMAAAREAGVSRLAWLAWTRRCEVRSVMAWDDPMPFLRGQVWPKLAARVGGRRRASTGAGPLA